MKKNSAAAPDVLNKQHELWEDTYSEEPTLFGEIPSLAAKRAVEIFKKDDTTKILDLGCGHGRDTLFFAQQGLTVFALDYSQNAIDVLKRRAWSLGLSNSIVAMQHDVRDPLPFRNESIDGCYSHMLCCMALTTPQLESLFYEIHRVLKPGRLNTYTARRTDDPHYGKGKARNGDMFEIDGYIVHFFNEEKVRSLTKGFTILKIERFEEGKLPRTLFQVTLKRTS